MTFEEALVLTHTVGSSAAYEDEALAGLWHAVTHIPRRSTIVEIGCEHGRSTSLLAQVAKEHEHTLILVEPVVRASLVEMLERLDVHYTLFRRKSREWQYWTGFFGTLKLLHVDGDHSESEVLYDAGHMELLDHGGFACFHDYGGGGTPEVKPAVDKYLSTHPGFKLVGLHHTCALFQRDRRSS